MMSELKNTISCIIVDDEPIAREILQNHLKKIESMNEFRVDSAIMGRVLYENKFSCQKFWCWNHKETIDLMTPSTAQLQKP